MIQDNEGRIYNIQVFFTVPYSGKALMTLATPLDPSDEDWSRVTQIVCGIIGNRVDMKQLYSRPLPCAATSMSMGAADVSPASSKPLRPGT
jgi:hypothetical protein